MANQPVLLSTGAQLEVSLLIEPHGPVFKMVGVVNEDVNFGSIHSLLVAHLQGNTQDLMVDLGEVTQINSCGIREWLLFMERLRAARINCVFLEISEVFVEQAIILPGLLGKQGTPVIAFQAPYYCEKCGDRTTRTLVTRDLKLAANSFTAPVFTCVRCADQCKFDGVESEYYAFLKHSIKA